MLPQHTDLLDRYRALVTAGEIQYDEEQIRVVMQVGGYFDLGMNCGLEPLAAKVAEGARRLLPSHGGPASP
jgi:hypothetical protein